MAEVARQRGNTVCSRPHFGSDSRLAFLGYAFTRRDSMMSSTCAVTSRVAFTIFNNFNPAIEPPHPQLCQTRYRNPHLCASPLWLNKCVLLHRREVDGRMWRRSRPVQQQQQQQLHYQKRRFTLPNPESLLFSSFYYYKF